MRDLAARLRDIVRRESGVPGGTGGTPSVPVRELTYVPDGYGVDEASLEPMAVRMGGTPVDEAGTCLMIDRLYAGDRSHGRHRIETCRPNRASPVELFDARVTTVPEWWRRVVFFDIETTGLSGGAGTLAFLVGCAWFQADGSFIVRQFFLAGPSGEKAMLQALAGVFDDASLLVTYNGRTFDVPFMETRWAYHRTAAPTGDLPHFDMLPPARRLWGRRDLARPEGDGCSLSAIERRVLGFHRHDDVPGFEIPARYFQFLRTGDAALVEGVLEHNRHDLVSLAAVMSHALWMVQEGPEACRDAAEQLAVGQIYERAGDLERAHEAYDMATRTGDADVQRPAWARLAVMHRRAGQFDRSAAAWQRILDLVPRSRRALTTIERQAMQALAVHHEHRARDLNRARGYAEALSATTVGRHKADTERRLERLSRKMRSETVGGKLALGYDPEGS
jgi:uncharacterized protein YprB with RNaseH-like and TPR domain